MLQKTLHIAVEARLISAHNEGMGIYTYLSNVLLGLQNKYNVNLHGEAPRYHFYLLGINEINLKRLGLLAEHCTVTLLPVSENNIYTYDKVAYFKVFQETVIAIKPKIDIVFFPHIEFPKDSHLWRKHGIKVVCVVHDLIPTYFIAPSVILRGIFSGRIRLEAMSSEGVSYYTRIKFNHRYWDKIITVSKTSERHLLKVIGFKQKPKVIVTPLGADETFRPYDKKTWDNWLPTLMAKRFDPTCYSHNDEYHASLKDPNSAQVVGDPLRYKEYIVYYGGYGLRRNIVLAIRACLEVLAELPQFQHIKIVMVGYGIRTRTLIEQGLHKDLVFLKFMTKQELAILIAGAKFTLQPPLIEGFGLPILESVRLNTPPLCSDIETTPAIIGRKYPRFNPYRLKDIKRVIKYFLTCPPAELTRLLTEAKDNAKHFSWEKTATLTHEALSSLFSNEVNDNEVRNKNR
ncbi:hypothetical protein COTS27_00702 [Spirochaetota bacterium]|nr:hypothetical protein COTS27_00702 [Spirochaetota bacterium]